MKSRRIQRKGTKKIKRMAMLKSKKLMNKNKNQMEIKKEGISKSKDTVKKAMLKKNGEDKK